MLFFTFKNSLMCFIQKLFLFSWNDGLAFCAMIHYYYPEAFDFEKLDPKNRRENFELAFTAAE